MYAKIILIIALFLASCNIAFWWVDNPWWYKVRGVSYWNETQISAQAVNYIKAWNLGAATRQLEADYRANHGGKSVKYRLSQNGNTIAIACSNFWLTYVTINRTPPPPPPPPPVNWSCGISGAVTSPLTGPSCAIGAGSALSTGVGNPRTYSWSCSGQNWGSAVSCSASFTQAECDPTTSNVTLRDTPFSSPTCKYGTVANFTPTTDAAGKTTYTWTCEKAWSTPASCTAYYKPMSTAPGQCDERYTVTDPRNPISHPPRLPEQCSYSVVANQPAISMTWLTMSTQDGPSVVSITWTTLSNNGYTLKSTCDIPTDWTPRLDCSADPFTTITSTLTSFTLPSSVTQRTGNCRVIFDSADTCTPREDTINIKPFPDCDPTISDFNNSRYCPREIRRDVCIQLNDKFGNPVNDYATGSIVSVLGPVRSNPYFEKYNAGTDTTVYGEGQFTVVDNNYCAPVVTDPQPTACVPTQTNPSAPDFCPCAVGDTRPVCTSIPESICIENSTNSCPVNTTACVPTSTNNFCQPPIPTTVPWCDDPNYSWDANLCVQKEKACTARLEVESQWVWTNNGDSIIYDEPAHYRITMNNDDIICRNGIISVTLATATGWVISGVVDWQADGTFFASISRGTDDTPKTPRWPSITATFTQPGGITYGLTERADDFDDTPLTITGNRMKWVRIIGNSAGTNNTNFNISNDGVIGEQSGPSVVAARNAIIKNAALLTRGVTANDSGRVVNNIYYAAGNNVTYSSVSTYWFKTLIVKWNLIIDSNIGDVLSASNPNRGIIVLKNDDGSGGNIIVGDTVTYIHALVFAEGTLRGTSTSAATLNIDTQLVLKGTLFSRNTVWGSADPSNLYLAGNAATTNRDLAFQQDLNNVRNGYGCPRANPSCSNLYKNYLDPFIIDFDNMQSDPPPGFSDIQ